MMHVIKRTKRIQIFGRESLGEGGNDDDDYDSNLFYSKIQSEKRFKNEDKENLPLRQDDKSHSTA